MGKSATSPAADRFWKYVAPMTDDRGCWEWTGARSHYGNGYGVIGTGRRGMPNIFAHRLSWEIHNGLIPEGLYVLHHCDNKSCVKPDHLYLGTYSDNLHDAWNRGLRKYKYAST